MFYATAFGAMLSMLLILSGTGIFFATMAFIFVASSALAFNIAGGLTRPSGSYVFFFAILVAILGLVVKVIVWEPAESMLHSPNTTMAAYTGSMLMMLGSVYLSRRFSRKQGFLQEICSVDDMALAAVGCVVGGTAIPILNQVAFATESELLIPLATALAQVDHFLAMAIILGTTSEIRSSGGKRSISAAVVAASLVIWTKGLFIGFSKEALFTPFFCWLAAGAALRYRYSLAQVVYLLVAAVFCVTYMVPYSQYGRNYADASKPLSEQIAVSYGLITHLGDVREKYQQIQVADLERESTFNFFSQPVGIFERLEMFGIDDALITITDEKGEFGMSPYVTYIAALIPRVLWKDKPAQGVGNRFAHELGFNEEDTTTGISITTTAEAYHEAKWFGVFVVQPILWTLLFVVTDSLCGDVRKSPWGILVISLFAHLAPEGALQALFYFMGYGAFGVTFVAFFSSYFMPLLASFVMPPKRKDVSIAGAREGTGPTFVNARPAPLRR